FDNNFSNKIGKEDASKISGSAETISIGLDNELLSIDARQMPQKDDTLFLKVAKLTKPKYTLQIFTNKMENTVQPYLVDAFLKTVQPLSVTDTNRIAFNVTSDAASFNPDRFKIIFNSTSMVQPVMVNPTVSELK